MSEQRQINVLSTNRKLPISSMVLSYSLGRAEAMDTKHYLVTDFQGRQMVVLRIYGDEAILTQLSAVVMTTKRSTKIPITAQATAASECCAAT